MALLLDEPPVRRCHLLAIGTATYADGWGKIGEAVRGELDAMVSVFRDSFRYEATTIIDPDRTLVERVAGWALDISWGANDVAVLYYTGHGVMPPGSPLRLILPHHTIDQGHVALVASELVSALWPDQPNRCHHLLVIIDTCHAGGSVPDILTMATKLHEAAGGTARGAEIHVIATARSIGRAHAGHFAAALREVIQQGTVARDDDEWLRADAVLGEVNRHLANASRGSGDQHAELAGRTEGDIPFFPNASWVPRLRSRMSPDARRRVLNHLHLAAFRSHWRPRARGVSVEADAAWRFTGRNAALRELAFWIATPSGSRGLYVTGRPGSGKSSVLSRLLVFSDPTSRAGPDVSQALASVAAPTVPPVGAIATAVHARRKSSDEVALEIAAGLDVSLSGSEDVVAELAQALKTDNRLVLVDGIEEATDPRAVASLLRYLLDESPTLRVLLGVRRGDPPPGPIIGELGANFLGVDLDAVRYLEREDLESLVFDTIRSPGAPYAGSGSERAARHAATAVASRAGESFLIASLAARTLAQSPSPLTEAQIDALPTTVGEWLEHELDALPTSERGRVRDLLGALAFAEGRGLPRQLWPHVAAALGGRTIVDRDVTRCLEQASHFVSVDDDGREDAYRLYHEEFTRYLRERATQVKPEVAVAVFEALRATVGAPRHGRRLWQHASPYIWRHLAAHAVAADRIDDLISDPTFLVFADPRRTLDALPHVTQEWPREAARVYELAWHHLDSATSGERVAYLQLVAAQHHGKPLPGLEMPEFPGPFRVLWSVWSPFAAHRILYRTRYEDDVEIATADTPHGTLIVVNTGKIECLRVTGEHVLGPLEAGAPMKGVATAGEWVVSVIVLGHPAVHAWTLQDGKLYATGAAPQLHYPGTWCAAAHEGQLFVVTVERADDDCDALVLRRADQGTFVEVRREIVPRVFVRGLAWTTFRGAAAVATVHLDRVLRVRSVDTGAVLAELPIGDRGGPIAASSSAEGAVIVCADFDSIVVVRERDGRLEIAHEPRAGHVDGVLAIRIGEYEGEPAFASIGRDNVARVSRLVDSERLFETLVAFRGVDLTGIAVGRIGGRSLVITSDSRGTVRMWRKERDVLAPPRTHTGLFMHMEAIDGPEGPRLVTLTNEGVIEEFAVHNGSRCQVIGLDGAEYTALGAFRSREQTLIGACRSDGVVTVWDAASHQARCELAVPDAGRINQMAIWPHGNGAVSVVLLSNRELMLIDLATLVITREPYDGTGPVRLGVVLGDDVTTILIPGRLSQASVATRRHGVGDESWRTCHVGGTMPAVLLQSATIGFWRSRPVVVAVTVAGARLTLFDGITGEVAAETEPQVVSDRIACAEWNNELLVVTSTTIGGIHVWRWPDHIASFDTDCTPNALAIVPGVGVAIAANEGLMLLDVGGLFTPAPPASS